MSGDADIATVATLIGEPARAAVLMALIDGRALAASTLAAEAGIAPSTVSGHLARLADAGLISVQASGRHRYYRLAGPEVAQALESLARLAPGRPITSLRQSTHAQALRRARTCYDHLAGRLGVAIADALLTDDLLTVEPDPDGRADPVLGAGRARRYRLTPGGRERLTGLGVDLHRPSRRPLIRYCVDWSEQRPHLGGRLGAALLDMLLAREWVRRGDRRIIHLTEAGRTGLAEHLAVDTNALG